MSHFGDNVASFLRNAATQLEELQVQTALGKAELADKLEEIKKETKDKINHIKWDVNSVVEDGKDAYESIKSKVEHLQVQLALGKAETADEIHEQKKKISAAIHDVKHLISKD
jgi:hypothetical protein